MQRFVMTCEVSTVWCYISSSWVIETTIWCGGKVPVHKVRV